MTKTGLSAQQCSPFTRTKVDLMLCLPKKYLKSIQHHIKRGLENPQCFCLYYTVCPGKLFHTLITRCVKQILPNICTEFLLSQFPFMPSRSVNQTQRKKLLIVNFVNPFNEFESLNEIAPRSSFS